MERVETGTGISRIPLAFFRAMLAWRDMTNQVIAARIAGYIRQAAIGDPLVPYEQRLDHTPQELLASRS